MTNLSPESPAVKRSRGSQARSMHTKARACQEWPLSILKPQADPNPHEAPAPYSYNKKAFPKHFLRIFFPPLEREIANLQSKAAEARGSEAYE